MTNEIQNPNVKYQNNSFVIWNLTFACLPDRQGFILDFEFCHLSLIRL